MHCCGPENIGGSLNVGADAIGMMEYRAGQAIAGIRDALDVLDECNGAVTAKYSPSDKLLDRWRQNRQWLKENEFTSNLEGAANELYVLRTVLDGLEVDDDYVRDGVVSMIDTVARKLEDLAHGRVSGDMLPD